MEKATEILLRERAVIFDEEIVQWMKGLRVWVFLTLMIMVVGVFFVWFLIGAIALNIWLMVLLSKGMKAKRKNIEDNKKEIKSFRK